MPRKISPASGWNYPDLDNKTADELFASIFPEEFLEEMFRKLGIDDPLHKTRLRQILRSGMILYRLHKAVDPNRPSASQIRAWVSKVDESFREQRNLFENIDAASRELFGMSYTLNLAHKSEVVQLDSDQIYPSDEDSADDVSINPIDRIMLGIDFGQSIIEQMKSHLPPVKQGPVRNDALRDWLEEPAVFWERDLGRRITFVHGVPAPRRSFHRFCELVLERLDPDAVRLLPTILEERRSQADD